MKIYLLLICLAVLPLRAVAQSTPATPATPVKPAGASSPQTTAPGAMHVSKEDWSVLPLSGHELEPHSAFVQQHDEHPGYTRDLVRVQWRAGDPIDLFVFLPTKVKHPPVILYLYSYPSDTQRFFDAGWAERTTAGGYAAVGFVSALTGSRFHTRPMKQWFVSELQEAMATSVHDVQMVLNYMASRNDVDMTKVGMFGQGSGGAIALLAAQADPRIKVLDLLNPWGDWPDWLKDSKAIEDPERANLLKPDFLYRASLVEPLDALHHLRVAGQLSGLRIQQIGGDMATPPSAAQKIAAAAPSGAIVRNYPDTHAHQQEMRSFGLSGWLKSELATTANASVAAPSGGEKSSGKSTTP